MWWALELASSCRAVKSAKSFRARTVRWGAKLTQAASIVFAYKLTDANPLIEGIVFHRQVDHAAEIKGDGMALGIRTETGVKYAFGVFANMDKGNSPEYTDFALPVLGITSWAQVGLQ